MSKQAAPILPTCPLAQLALGSEARRLVDLLPDFDARTTVLATFTELFPIADDASSMWRFAVSASKRKTGEYPLAALLTHPPATDVSNRRDLEALQFWVLAAALDAIAADDYKHSTWKEAARAVRHLCTLPRYAELRLRVPALVGKDLRSVREAIASWVESEHNSGSGFHSKLDNIRRAMAQLDTDTRRHLGQRRKAEIQRSRAFAECAAASLPVMPDSTLEVSIGCVGHDHDTDPLHSAEEAADLAEPVYLRSVSADQDDMIDQLLEVEAETASIMASRHLTSAESRNLYRSLARDIDADATEPGVIMLVSSLLLNASIAEMVALPRQVPKSAGQSWWDIRGKFVAIAYAPMVTGAKEGDEGAFSLSVPVSLGQRIVGILDEGITASVLENQARRWLKRQTGRANRLSRIAQCLSSALRSEGEDEAVRGALCREDIRHVPQLYYSRLPVERLNHAYERFQRGWLGIPSTPSRCVTKTGKGGAIGSKRVPPHTCIERFHRRMEDNLASAWGEVEERRPNAVPKYHAAFVAQTAALLAFATAVRPHGTACPSFLQMQLVGPYPVIRICDKGNRSVDDARWLPAPGVMVDSFQQLQAHLAWLRAWASLAHPEVCHAIDASLRGETSPLWYFPSPGKDVTPLRWAEFWEQYRPQRQPRNFFRHYWRTEFLRTGTTGWAIDFWMGHGGWKSAQYLPTGAFCAAEMNDIKTRINAKAQHLELCVPTARKLPV